MKLCGLFGIMAVIFLLLMATLLLIPDPKGVLYAIFFVLIILPLVLAPNPLAEIEIMSKSVSYKLYSVSLGLMTVVCAVTLKGYAFWCALSVISLEIICLNYLRLAKEIEVIMKKRSR